MLQNKYSKHYWLLIEKAKNREVPAGYVENHHVIPKSCGGANTLDNLVHLTAREHFVAHLLLTKCYDGIEKDKMFYALHYMVHGQQNKYYQINSRLYEYYKHEYDIINRQRKTQLGRRHTEESKRKMRLAKLGCKLTESHKEKIRLSGIGKKLSDGQKEKIRAKLKGNVNGRGNAGRRSPMTGKKHSEETIRKMRLSKLGKKRSLEFCEKMRKANIGKRHSEETKTKMSISHKKIKTTKEETFYDTTIQY